MLTRTFTVRSCPHSVRRDIPLASKATSYAIPFFTPGRTFFKATFLFNTRNLHWSGCFSFSSAFFALHKYTQCQSIKRTDGMSLFQSPVQRSRCRHNPQKSLLVQKIVIEFLFQIFCIVTSEC